MGRSRVQSNTEVAGLVVLGHVMSTQRQSLMEMPLHRGKEAANCRSCRGRSLFVRIDWSASSPPPAFACLREVPLDSILSMEETDSRQAQAAGIGMLWLISASMRSVLRRMP